MGCALNLLLSGPLLQDCHIGRPPFGGQIWESLFYITLQMARTILA